MKLLITAIVILIVVAMITIGPGETSVETNEDDDNENLAGEAYRGFKGIINPTEESSDSGEEQQD